MDPSSVARAPWPSRFLSASPYVPGPRAVRFWTLAFLVLLGAGLLDLLSHWGGPWTLTTLSPRRLALLAGHIAVVSLAVVVTIRPVVLRRLLERLAEGLRRSSVVTTGWLAAVVLCPAAVAILLVRSEEMPSWSALLPQAIALVAYFFWLSFRLWSTGVAEKLARYYLLVASLLGGAWTSDFLLRFYPRLLPGPWFPSDAIKTHRDKVFDKPIRIGYRYKPLLPVRSWVVDPMDAAVQGPWAIDTIAPPKERRRVVQTLRTDENGFANDPPVRGKQYPLVVVGDSFVMPYTEPSWVRLLERMTGLPTLDLGMPGWGPQSEAAALDLCGFSARPRWVILAYFDGNDLINAADYERRRASGLSWLEYDQVRANQHGLVVLPTLFRYSWAKGRRLFRPRSAYRYPVTLNLQGRDVPIAFFGGHVSMATGSAEQIRRSANFALVRETLLHIKRQCDRTGVRFLIVEIPSKERVYLPLVLRSGKLASVLTGTRAIVLGSDGYMVPADEEVTPDDLGHLNDQATVIAQLAETHGIDFLDLLPFFREQADQGIALYYYADGHWDEAGQRLAAAAVASHLAWLEREAGPPPSAPLH